MIHFTLEQGIAVSLPSELAAVLLGMGQPQHIEPPAVHSVAFHPELQPVGLQMGLFPSVVFLLFILVRRTRRLGQRD